MKSKRSKGFIALEGVIVVSLATLSIASLGWVWRREWQIIQCERALFRRAHAARMASADDEVRTLGFCGSGRRELVMKSLDLHEFDRGERL